MMKIRLFWELNTIIWYNAIYFWIIVWKGTQKFTFFRGFFLTTPLCPAVLLRDFLHSLIIYSSETRQLFSLSQPGELGFNLKRVSCSYFLCSLWHLRDGAKFRRGYGELPRAMEITTILHDQEEVPLFISIRYPAVPHTPSWGFPVVP